MAFSRFLRRAASSTAPHLLRSFSPSACASRPLSLVSSQSMILRHRWAFSSSSSAMQKAPIDSSLLRVLESEIKCAEEVNDPEHVDEVPEGFPFEIEDKTGMNIIRLKRIYQGKEKIEVTVSRLVTGEERVEDSEDDEDEEDDEWEEGLRMCVQAQSRIPITVRVSKDEGGPALEFACTVYQDEVRIDSMSVIESRGGEEEDNLHKYQGPNFKDLEERLKKAFHKYLELRGITPLNTNFIHKYMINKDSREYLLWVRKLKAIVQK